MTKRTSLYLILLVLMSVLSTALTFWWGDFYLVDSHEYWESSKYWLGNEVPDDLSDLTKRPPIYPLFLGVFGAAGAIILQNAMLVFTFYRMFRFLCPGTLSKIQLRWVYLSTFTSFNAFLYADKYMAETLALMGLWLMIEWFTQKRWIWLLLIVALLPFVKPVFLFLPLALLPLFLWRKETRVWSLGLLMCAGVSYAYIYTNEQRTGAAEFSSIQHINALHYNKYQFDVHRFGVDYAARVNDSIKRLGRDLPYEQRVALYNGAFLDEVKSAPLDYLWFHALGAMRGTIDPGRFDLQFLLPTTIEEGFAHREGGGILNYLRGLNPIILIVLLPIALLNAGRIGLALLGVWRTQNRPSTWLSVILIVYVVGLTGPINASRFMVPVVPLLIWLSTLGWRQRRSNGTTSAS